MRNAPPYPRDLGWLIGPPGQLYAKTIGAGRAYVARVADIDSDVAGRLARPRITGREQHYALDF